VNDFAGRTAVVTGATSGIGRAIALALAADGAVVRAHGRRGDALDDLELADSSIRGEQVDLLADGEMAELAQRLHADWSRLDFLVHAAGTFARGPFACSPVDGLDRLYGVNLRAPFVLTQHLLPAVRRARGQIVFVNSSVVTTAAASLSQYAATKHALKALADSLRCEVNRDGVRVISIYPGRTASPMQQHVHALEARPYRPGDLLQPEDVAAVTVDALRLPRTAELTDVHVRPMRRPS
jgi:NAD(P)-dependent dehydrogenase (short-subunit alcohol dehydrogenase family)